VVEQRRRRTVRHRRGQHVRNRQHLTGEVPGQSADGERLERARLVPATLDRRVAEKPERRRAGVEIGLPHRRHARDSRGLTSDLAAGYQPRKGAPEVR
jgi:hypothetical protein